jgi:hypothetical protein
LCRKKLRARSKKFLSFRASPQNLKLFTLGMPPLAKRAKG